MEYCRDEGVRGYWNSWSEPFHKEGNDQVYYNYLPNNDEQQFDRMGSSTVSVQRGTAYLHIPMEGLASETLQMVFDDDGELTDIIKVFGLQVDRGDNGYYTLDGKRVSPTGNGLYIHNGKKVVVNSTTTVK
jgi:hypothetical protein